MRLLGYNFDAVRIKSSGTQQRVAYVATELLPGGELFDFVALKAFTEPVCRFYFK